MYWIELCEIDRERTFNQLIIFFKPGPTLKEIGNDSATFEFILVRSSLFET